MERRPEIVLDSSIAVKWFAKESDSKMALQLMKSHVNQTIKLWVVDITYSEVVNALKYNTSFNLNSIILCIDSLYSLHMGTQPITKSILQRSTEIAIDGEATIYDTLPVALAETRNTFCITEDRKTQYNKLAPKGYPIKLLSDVDPMRLDNY